MIALALARKAGYSWQKRGFQHSLESSSWSPFLRSYLRDSGGVAVIAETSLATSAFGHASSRCLRGTRLPCYVFDTGRELARHVAQIVAGVIRERNALGQKAVLGLPTGSTPVGVYRELIRLHREEGLDFSQRRHVQPRRVLRPRSPTSCKATTAGCTSTSSST